MRLETLIILSVEWNSYELYSRGKRPKYWWAKCFKNLKDAPWNADYSTRKRAFRRAYLKLCRWWSPFGRGGVDRLIENRFKNQSKTTPKSITKVIQNVGKNRPNSVGNATQIHEKSIVDAEHRRTQRHWPLEAEEFKARSWQTSATLAQKRVEKTCRNHEHIIEMGTKIH